MYSPICQRDIEPANKEDVETGHDESYIYVHNDLPHSEDEIEALKYGIN